MSFQRRRQNTSSERLQSRQQTGLQDSASDRDKPQRHPLRRSRSRLLASVLNRSISTRRWRHSSSSPYECHQKRVIRSTTDLWPIAPLSYSTEVTGRSWSSCCHYWTTLFSVHCRRSESMVWFLHQLTSNFIVYNNNDDNDDNNNHNEVVVVVVVVRATLIKLTDNTNNVLNVLNKRFSFTWPSTAELTVSCRREPRYSTKLHAEFTDFFRWKLWFLLISFKNMFTEGLNNNNYTVHSPTASRTVRADISLNSCCQKSVSKTSTVVRLTEPTKICYRVNLLQNPTGISGISGNFLIQKRK